jgi:hypothetical protein
MEEQLGERLTQPSVQGVGRDNPAFQARRGALNCHVGYEQGRGGDCDHLTGSSKGLELSR